MSSILVTEELDDLRVHRRRRSAKVAATSSVVLILAAFFCVLAPNLVFHTSDPDAYPMLRNAAPAFVVASIIALHVWAWLTIILNWPRHTTRFSRVITVVTWSLILSVLTAGVVFILWTVFTSLHLVTTDWMMF